MKNVIFGIFVATLLSTQLALAEVKVAVIDIQAAILSSERAKERIAELKKEYAPDQKEINDLARDIKRLQTKMEQDAAVMSDTEIRKLKKDVEAKAIDYQFNVKKLQKAQQESQQELMIELGPKLEAAIKSVIEEGGYNLVLERKSVISVSPDFDLTKKVTEKINLNR